MRVCWSVSAFAAVIGCAGGAESPAGPITTTFASSTAPGSASTTTPESDTTFDDASDSDDESTSFPVETADPAESDSLDESSAGDSSTSLPDPTGVEESSSDDGMPVPECPNETVCGNAEVIGMVSGDSNSPAIQASGSEPVWLTFQVTEDNDAVTGEALAFTATLSSPPGVDFDLYVYRGAANGQTGCGGVMDSSTAAVGNDVVHMGWGEGGVANGVDDRSWVAVEIIPKGDMCPYGGQWSLNVVGDM